jgi:hypothetical protein
MKKIALLFLLNALGFGAQAQLTSINENFDSNCPLGNHHPTGWSDMNPILSTMPKGQWACTVNGREGTPGIQCTGYWDGAFHLDTALLISPILDLSGYSGQNIFMRFDSKTTQVHLGGKLSIFAATDSGTKGIGLDDYLSPIFNENDSTDWVTHQVNLTPYTAFGNFVVIFMYTSTEAKSSVWSLDNIFTTTIPLEVANPIRKPFQFSASGSVSTGNITISYAPLKMEPHDVLICDIVGRVVHRETLNPQNRNEAHTIHGLNLSEGLFLVKMWNGKDFSTEKVYIR